MKKSVGLALLTGLTAVLAACGSDAGAGEEASKEVKLGGTSGPYSDMLTKAIKPGLEEKGYEVEVVEFSDYIVPNRSLDNGDIQANLFQHKVYMDTFAEENDMELSELIVVPTAPMGIYSDTYDSLEDVEDGAEIAIPNDPTNAARVFLILEAEGLIKVDESASPLTISEKDITENVKNLTFVPIEAGQLPRAVEQVDLAAVPGNFALAASMDLLDALVLEDMPDEYRNRVVVKTEDAESELSQDIIEVVESEEFEQVIDEEFQGFGKPEWMENAE